MIVRYRERMYIDNYRCIDTEKSFHTTSYFIPAGCSLYYFRINQFEMKTVAIDDIISIEE